MLLSYQGQLVQLVLVKRLKTNQNKFEVSDANIAFQKKYFFTSVQLFLFIIVLPVPFISS